MSTLKPEMLNVSSTINGTMINNTTTMVPLTNLKMTSTTEVNPFLSQWNITDNGNNGGYWNYSTSWNNSGYGNGYWNDSTWIPYCPSCYPVVVDTPSYTYFSYAYIYYILLMMLFIGAIICIKVCPLVILYQGFGRIANITECFLF